MLVTGRMRGLVGALVDVDVGAEMAVVSKADSRFHAPISAVFIHIQLRFGLVSRYVSMRFGSSSVRFG